MWGDECYYSIEGECEFFQDWLMQTKDEVKIFSILGTFIAIVFKIIEYNYFHLNYINYFPER